MEMNKLSENVTKKGRHIISESDQLGLTFQGPQGHLRKIIWKKDYEEIRLSEFEEKTWPRIPYQIEWVDQLSGFRIRLKLKDPIVTLITASKEQ